jgi:serine kinase of HPr protein (carbohydrate metabolism regulator)
MIRHAGLIARFDRGRWRGVLIEGAAGSGKSDLALRALGRGWALIADDRTLVWTAAGRLYGRAPATLAGLIEVRGLGVLSEPSRAFAEIVLVARCADPALVERLPAPASETILDVLIPRVILAALEASAPAKLGRALSVLDSVGERRIKTPAPAAFLPDAGGVP